MIAVGAGLLLDLCLLLQSDTAIISFPVAAKEAHFYAEAADIFFFFFQKLARVEMSDEWIINTQPF